MNTTHTQAERLKAVPPQALAEAKATVRAMLRAMKPRIDEMQGLVTDARRVARLEMGIDWDEE